MRTFLNILRFLFYIAALVFLFSGTELLGIPAGQIKALFIDMGCFFVLAILGVVCSYLRTYVFKDKNKPDAQDVSQKS